MTTSCGALDRDRRAARAQAKRDLLYAIIVALCFMTGVGVVVGVVALAQPILAALLPVA